MTHFIRETEQPTRPRLVGPPPADQQVAAGLAYIEAQKQALMRTYSAASNAAPPMILPEPLYTDSDEPAAWYYGVNAAGKPNWSFAEEKARSNAQAAYLEAMKPPPRPGAAREAYLRDEIDQEEFERRVALEVAAEKPEPMVPLPAHDTPGARRALLLGNILFVVGILVLASTTALALNSPILLTTGACALLAAPAIMRG